MIKQNEQAANLPSLKLNVAETSNEFKENWENCLIGDNIQFNTEGLESYCLSSSNPIVNDALVVAAAIEFCDRHKKRPSTSWARNYIVRIPVSDPSHWLSPSVYKSLICALNFLTGDMWEIRFINKKSKEIKRRQSNFEIPNESGIILPFSDGIDSLAVSKIVKNDIDGNLLTVRLGGSGARSTSRNTEKVPFMVVPYAVKPIKRSFAENSARSRGFKFAILTGIASCLSKSKQIVVSESGQGALGPALVPVGQIYEDYRNHPTYLKLMEVFLYSLFNHKVNFIFPRLWHTKAETMSEFLELKGDSSELFSTKSCWQSQRQTSVHGHKRQCGICAACMLRRMSMHANSLRERPDTYVWEALNAENYSDGAPIEYKSRKPSGAMYHYAIAGTLHLDYLARFRHSKDSSHVLDYSIIQLGRAFDTPQKLVKEKLLRMLRQHESEWRDFIASLGPSSFILKWASWAQNNV